MTGSWGALAGLFVSSFVSATLLPGNSEIVLGAIVAATPALALARGRASPRSATRSAG